jgi:hypothetical protein
MCVGKYPVSVLAILFQTYSTLKQALAVHRLTRLVWKYPWFYYAQRTTNVLTGW